MPTPIALMLGQAQSEREAPSEDVPREATAPLGISRLLVGVFLLGGLVIAWLSY